MQTGLMCATTCNTSSAAAGLIDSQTLTKTVRMTAHQDKLVMPSFVVLLSQIPQSHHKSYPDVQLAGQGQ